ncbi:MAG: hypothetical protein JNL21_21395 [Myxococcales bacterium]|nr:hypothetical protein [Myxococcales bacterium]
MRPLACWLSFAALVGCSSPSPEPTVATSPASDGTAEPEPTDGPAASSDPGEPPPSSVAGAREILRKDCAALADKYGELVRVEEASKLDPKLSQSQVDTVKGRIDAAARTLAERFREGCEQSLVGKFAEEASLQCAMSAKRLSDFDVCMNGPAAPPAK